jgi:hypothetical protein
VSGHLSMRPTWTSPGRVDGPAWPCTGRGLPGRRVTAAPVRSYRTISPLPVRDARADAPSAVCFCGTFPRVSPGGRYPPPCPSVSGLSSRGFLSPRGRSARSADGSPWLQGRNPERKGVPLVAIASNTLTGDADGLVTGAGSGLGRASQSARPRWSSTCATRTPAGPRRRSAGSPSAAGDARRPQALTGVRRLCGKRRPLCPGSGPRWCESAPSPRSRAAAGRGPPRGSSA